MTALRIDHGFALGVVICVGVFTRPLFLSHQQTRLTRSACEALALEDWSAAEQFAEKILSDHPEHSTALTVAGIAAARLHRHEDALALLSRVPQSGSTEGHVALLELGNRYTRIGRMSEAEQCFHAVLDNDPTDIAARRELVNLLTFQGRCVEAVPFLLGVVHSGEFRADELIMLGMPERLTRRDQGLQMACKGQRPECPDFRLGECKLHITNHRYDDAEPILIQLTTGSATIPLAHGLLGEIYLEQNRMAELIQWEKELPTVAQDSPHVWYILGLWAHRMEQPEWAARCLLEAVRKYPQHVRATYLLSQVFQQLGDAENAKRLSKRSVLLSKLEVLSYDLQDGPDPKLIREAVDTLETLGRFWEAMGWCKIASQWTNEKWPATHLARLRPVALQQPGQYVSTEWSIADIDVTRFSLPNWSFDTTDRLSDQRVDQAPPVRFIDEAAEVNLGFQYFNSMDPDVGLEQIFQTIGGGIAAIDFDRDLWPDVYFANGRQLPDVVSEINTPQTQHVDRIFRNTGRGRFLDITSEAGLGDDRFSQGVTAGDYDNDGFPDLYVANVGGNRFYHNNGDGTFSNVSTSAGTSGNQWTTSVMLADVNADGFSDIYAVNYLKMDEVFSRKCERNGQPLTCAPTLFSADQDRLYLNLADGRFRDVTEECGIRHSRGKGLGVVGLRSPGRVGLNIFVGNDTTENLYFENIGTTLGSPSFQENALLAGVAMNDAGAIQACMGIAAGDGNMDGLTDLFVTNYFADSNTMYYQTSAGTFSDVTRQSRLAEPSYDMLGFGTQFLDAELDGDADLIVANGHVDQTATTGHPDLMPAQFFLNDGHGQFVPVPHADVGIFFEEKHLGRSLARVDWNRDGLNDVCLMHLDAPVALLSNHSQTTNQPLVIRLVGTKSSRDATGSVVTVQLDKRKMTQQLTAGDGYQACNEKKLIFGIAPDEIIQSVRVEWPSGISQAVKQTQTRNWSELVVSEGKVAMPIGD